MFAMTIRPDKPREADSRKVQIAVLTEMYNRERSLGATDREAIREVARLTDLHPMTIKRLVILYPEA